jgi:hypothetical protein
MINWNRLEKEFCRELEVIYRLKVTSTNKIVPETYVTTIKKDVQKMLDDNMFSKLPEKYGEL